jgi:probable HAF family extracellular repeat protein
LGGTSSSARGINSVGNVVGSSDILGDAVQHVFVYIGTPGVNGQMIDLDTWLDINNPVNGLNWTLTEARGLTDSGLVVGTGTYNDGPGGLSDGTRAFLLDASALVPEPPAAATLLLALPFLLSRRRAKALREIP